MRHVLKGLKISAVRGVAASAHGRSPFHPHSTASSPGSARKNFWRVVIVEVRPADEPARTSSSAQGLPSPELDPAPLRWKSRASNDAAASSATEHQSAFPTKHRPLPHTSCTELAGPGSKGVDRGRHSPF
jgi:hypothetical protein